MKILLSTLPREGEFVNWTTPKVFMPSEVKYMPLGILSLASNLPKGNEVVILDPSSENWTIDKTIEEIEKQSPDVLGISAQTRRIWAMNEILKKTSTPYKAVGGPHVTHYAQETLMSGADAVFVGQLADKEFASAVETRPRGIINCNTAINYINYPRRELLDIDSYFFKGKVLFTAEKRMPMFSSVGCPNHCKFCNVQSKQVGLKNPKIVVEEMTYLLSLGSKSVHVLDDNFNIYTRHLEGILNEMDRWGFNTEWSGRGQTRMDFRLVKRMVEHGFKRIHVGFEALDNEILKFFNKRQNVSDIERFCAAMNSNGVEMLGYFISGSPVETEEYRRNLPEKIKSLGIKHPFFNILFPEPNTEYYSSLLKDGTYKTDYWGEFMKNPTPYYEIPYPYGEVKRDELIAHNNGLIAAFKTK